MAAIIGTVLSAVLVPLLAWFFSGSNTKEVKRAAGLQDLDDVHGGGDLKLPPI
jgi:hypothetical protein